VDTDALGRRILTFAHVMRARPKVFPVKVTVGGVPAEILYAGNLGVLSVNFRVPLNAPVGDAVPVVLTAGNSRNPDGVTMAIQSRDRAVLVINPEAGVREKFRQILAGAGYAVFAAADSREASALAGDHRIDLVIADLATSDRARSALLDSMRGARPLLKTAVLMADVRPVNLRAADLLGAQAVLTMPLQSETVVKKVRDLLTEQPARY
jgi:CheY-like chemotaxis protein